MKASSWILGGAAVVAAVYVLSNRPGLQTGDGSLQDAADSTSRWGTKQSFAGIGEAAAGKLKQGFGELTGNRRMEGEGVIDQAAGGLKDLAGNAAHAVSDLSR